MMRWKIEIRKAAVLPVPVWDCAYMSPPENAYSKTLSCTGMQVT